MRYDLGVKARYQLVRRVIYGAFCAFMVIASPAKAEIDIAALGAQSTMAEQGAICASFAALMENQLLINQNLGDLWSERRKFSGAVIRRAVELSNLPTPSSDDIDLLINDYREWLILNLSAKDPNVSVGDYQSDVQNMIKTNCKSLYQQADKAITKRFPDLAYLIDETIIEARQQDSKQLSALMAKNKELNLQIITLRAELNVLKAQQKKIEQKKVEQTEDSAQEVIEVIQPALKPTPRPDAPKKPAQKQVTQTSSQKRFFAQLGSFSSEETALSAMADFTDNYPQLFADISLQIKPHQFTSGKIFYRVRTSDADRPLITSICDKLWDARMGCLIKTNID